MKRKAEHHCEAITRVRVLVSLLAGIVLPLLAYAAAPGWWTQRGVLAANAQPDDYAPANIGQLKKLASAAAAQMDANLPNGAGDAVHNLVNSWSTPTAQTNDFALVNLGQLKEVAKPFYDRLIAAGLVPSAYPWDSANTADDYAAANLGQLKNLFAFDIPLVDVPPQNIDSMLAIGSRAASMALEPAGAVWIWDDHFSSGSDFERKYPQRFTVVRNVNSVAAAQDALAVLRTDGTVWTWGKNGSGQLGDGTNNDRTNPAPVPNLTNVASLRAGAAHVLALLQDGTVAAWGDNSEGQLGTGDTTSVSTPVAVASLVNVAKIAAGGYRSMALAGDGTVWTWGYDHYDGRDMFNPTPAAVANLQDVIDVAAGYEHVVAVQNDGTVWAWGSNYSNQVANGRQQFQTTPFLVPNLPAITKVASKWDHTLAIAADGTVWAWGENFDGQLGDGTTLVRQTPVQVRELTDVIAVATEYSYSMAMKADGTVWAWGDGAPGVAPGADTHVPQQVTLGLLDTNSNGMDDRWELQYFGALDQTGEGDFDRDGISNLQEYLRHSDPTDYFNGATPVVEIVSGNNQFGDAGTVLGQPLTVRLRNAAGQILPNAPVRFAISSGSGALALASNGALQGSQLVARSGSDGMARAWLQLPSVAGVVDRITASAGTPTNSAASVFRAGSRYQSPPSPTATPDPYATPTASPSPTATPAAPYRYAIVDLGKEIYPIRINNKGTVLVNGYDAAQPNVSYFRWKAGKLEPLTFSDPNAAGQATDLNDNDSVVGSSAQPGSSDDERELSSGAVWGAGQAIAQKLSAPSSYSGFGPYTWYVHFRSASLSAINNSGDVYGSIYTGAVEGFLYSTIFVQNSAVWLGGAGSPTQLSDASAVNDQPDNGFISHWTGSSDTITRASTTHYIGKKLSDLYTSGFSVAGTRTGMVDGQAVSFTPLDLNEAGVVVGRDDSAGSMVIHPPAGADQMLTSSNAIYPVAINDHTRVPRPSPSSTPGASATPVPAPQILGWDGSTTVLWERQADGSWYGTGLEEMIPTMDGWQIGDIVDMNDGGMVVGAGWFSDPADPQAQPEQHGFMLVPVALIVDGNRDGQMSVDATDDMTSKDRPYRFWLNDDDDTELQINELGGAPLEADAVPVATPDYTRHAIISKRNLEDFARLWIYLGGAHDKILSGELQVGLRWKTIGSGSPAINIYPSADGEGSDSYLKDEDAAAAQIQGAFGTIVTDKNSKQAVDTNGTFIFKRDYCTGLSTDHPKKCLLFEGASEGKGELTIVFLDQSGTEIAQGGSVWLDLKDVKRMYVRGEAYFPEYHSPYVQNPYTGNPGAARSVDEYGYDSPFEEEDRAIIFVHGIHAPALVQDEKTIMAEWYATSETVFKRLWWQGFGGRFASFKWAALQPAVPFAFNESEYRAWQLGEQLTAFVNEIPKSRKSLMAHSQGNAVCGQALRIGSLAVENYAAMQAAVPAGSYDPRDAVNQYQRFLDAENTQGATPDTAADLGYRGYLANLSVTRRVVSFTNPVDFALATGTQLLGSVESNWEANEVTWKPQTLADRAYYYDPLGADGGPPRRIVVPGSGALIRAVSDGRESMGFLARPRSRALGAATGITGSVTSEVDLSAAPYNFTRDASEHSGEFERPVQTAWPFYKTLIDVFQ